MRVGCEAAGFDEVGFGVMQCEVAGFGTASCEVVGYQTARFGAARSGAAGSGRAGGGAARQTCTYCWKFNLI